MNNKIEDLIIEFYDFSICKCKASVKVCELDIFIPDFVVMNASNTVEVYMPAAYKTTWPFKEITWHEIRHAVLDEFKQKYQSFGSFNVEFEAIDNNVYLAKVDYDFLDIHLDGCKVKVKNKRPFINMPENFKNIWPYHSIAWLDVRNAMVEHFKKQRKTQKDVLNYIPMVSVHDVSNDGTALFDIEIPELQYELTDGAIYYISNDNININLPSDFPVNPENGLTRKGVLKTIREEYLKQINGIDITPYSKSETQCELESNKNKFGRIMDADGRPFMFVPNTELRPIGKIFDTNKFQTAKKLLKALSSNDIGIFEIDTLSIIEKFRYVNSNMIIDLFASGYISRGWRNINKNKLAGIFDRLAKHNLVNICKFVRVDESYRNNVTGEEIYRIFSLAETGNRLLSELGRVHHYNPFDVYQNGNFVKAILAANQWLVYWLSSYPEEIKDKYDTAKVIHALGAEKSGAKIYSMITCNDITLIGEPLRRTYEFDEPQNAIEIQEKLKRLFYLIDFKGDIYTNSGYKPVEYNLGNDSIICYICEDDDHIKEMWHIVKSIIMDNPSKKVWFTTDARLFNYSCENERFFMFDKDDQMNRVDLFNEMKLGKERAYDFIDQTSTESF